MLNKNPSELTVVVGEHDYTKNGDGEEYFEVEKIIEVFF